MAGGDVTKPTSMEVPQKTKIVDKLWTYPKCPKTEWIKKMRLCIHNGIILSTKEGDYVYRKTYCNWT